jgi:hypothetical protein
MAAPVAATPLTVTLELLLPPPHPVTAIAATTAASLMNRLVCIVYSWVDWIAAHPKNTVLATQSRVRGGLQQGNEKHAMQAGILLE